jgi:general secretion pathway protein L
MVWSATEQEIIGSGNIADAGELDTLVEKSQGREVKVLVPASDVTLKTVPLPGKFTRQIATALPYMLEDELTEDVDRLFFAIGNKTQLDGKPAIEVGIVSRVLMENWLAWLSGAGITSSVLLPDAMCLPLYDEGTCGIELNEQWLLRSSVWECTSVDSVWFDDYLKLSVEQFVASQEQDSEEAYTLVNHSPCLSTADNLVMLEKPKELPLQLLIQHMPSNGFNLLQGDFLLKKETSKLWAIWKHAAIIAGVAIIMQLAYRGSVAWQLSSELESEKLAFVAQFKKAFVGDRTRTGLMERQLKSRLKQAQGGADSSSGFLMMLDKIAPLLSKSSDFVANSFRYDAKRKELRLQATGNGFQSFELFKSGAENLGFTVQQGSLSNNDDKVAGAITIKRAG